MATEEEAEDETQTSLIVSSEKEANTYAHVKAAFEQICFRVESPYVFVKLPKRKVPGKMPDILSVEKVRSYFADIMYWEEKVNKKGIKKWVKKASLAGGCKTAASARSARSMWTPRARVAASTTSGQATLVTLCHQCPMMRLRGS